ncbi:MAG: EamA family transporter [Gemmatimonadaceae bacterium]
MTPTGIALIAVSALAHAYWNFLLKRAGGGNLFIALSKIVEAVVFAPVFLLWGLAGVPKTLAIAWIILVSASGVAITYSSLSQAYRYADLSYAYPISRGSMLLFLPLMAFVVRGERVDVVGGVGLALILAGVTTLQLKALNVGALRDIGEHVNGKGLAWALFTGFMLAAYTLWDKRAVNILAPFSYLYAYTATVAVAYAAYTVSRYTRSEVAAEWGTKRREIVQVGVLNTVSYLLALFALRGGVSSYVMGVRQSSIAIGVLFGYRLLGEAFTTPRRVGASLILAGCLLVSFAR